ncbi:hypothetical protein [Aeromonas sp.]|uniref:hypothetical protein n=1 Tax=Aeromonas sp. TaxID=647 RepID=UPI0025908C7E|nr:hypothetical protein [Aeromonas sp.]MCX7129957.1 hypothetical protein [Aeromonas sp.]
MSIRKEKLVLASRMTLAPLGAEGRIIYGNYRVRLRALSRIWDALMALLAYPIPEPAKTILWNEDIDQQLLKGLEIAITIQLHDAHRYSSISDRRLFHPFFIAMHDANIVNTHQTLMRRRLENMHTELSVRWRYRFELLEYLSTIKSVLLNNNNAGRNYERAVRDKKNTITNKIGALAQSHNSVYVLRLMLQTPKQTSFEDIMAAQEKLFDVMSRRNKICKDRLGYFWAISCDCNLDNVHTYYMALTLLFPATSVINQGRYLQEIKDTWCSDAKERTSEPCVGYLSSLHKQHTAIEKKPKIGDIINFTDPQHTDAINIMLREYYLEQRLVRINHPTKTAGISLTKE